MSDREESRIERVPGQVSAFEHATRRALARLIEGGTTAEASREFLPWPSRTDKQWGIALAETLAEAVRRS
jgi:hypothetical protein